MRERLAIVAGVRTPFCKAGGEMAAIAPDDLGAGVVKALLARTELDTSLVDEVIMGNVGQPANACNIARVIALKAGLPEHIPAYTVHRNCASGMQSITTGFEKMLAGSDEIVIAGGTESMSQYPLQYGAKMTALFANLMKAKTLPQRLALLAQFRPAYLKPVISIVEGLTDPICGLNMGQTAEVLAREFAITRADQDNYALHSHLKAAQAQQAGFFANEIQPLLLAPDYQQVQTQDGSIRAEQSIDKLAKLKPFFDRATGTITVANACPITDGAGAVLIMLESKAKAMGYQPLGYLRDFAYAGLGPKRMGLGPVYATSKLLNNCGMRLDEFDLIELNEAFAAQVIANQHAFASTQFAQTYLNQAQAVGEINPEQLNINGGAIALGHPVGATGTRLVITMLNALRAQQRQRGLVTLCIGGGQGAALILEVE